MQRKFKSGGHKMYLNDFLKIYCIRIYIIFFVNLRHYKFLHHINSHHRGILSDRTITDDGNAKEEKELNWCS